jgi:hypothetical protein
VIGVATLVLCLFDWVVMLHFLVDAYRAISLICNDVAAHH